MYVYIDTSILMYAFYFGYCITISDYKRFSEVEQC